jgi:hypothetical protein
MLTESRIRQRYIDCLDNATLWLNRNGYAVHPKDIRVLTQSDARGNVLVRTSQPFHFRDWPCRHDSADRLQILVSILDTISQADEACVCTSTNITYFRVAQGEALALESMHFDCAVPPGAQHPICHAQNNRRVVSPPPESFAWRIQDHPLQNRCPQARVPTAFINMPGVFTILAADHMQAVHWHDFMDHCLTRFRNVPGLPAHPVVTDAIPRDRLSAWAWYER